MNNLKFTILSGAILIGLAQTVQAACPLDGAKTLKIGPQDNLVTTFPLWIQDTTGLALEICPGTDQANCISVPPFTENDFPGDPNAIAKAALSQQIGFGDEGFWASAEAMIDLPGGGRALLVSAVEAAFLPDFQDGNQFPFTRLRLRIDVPQVGEYIVTHPWGQITYTINTPGIRAINDSFDIPFVADQVGYQGKIGPILTWDTFPNDSLLDQHDPAGEPDYIGTLAIEHKVKGSPCGTNYFRIDGPDIGGPNVNTIETDLFTVTGKIYNGSKLPTPLKVDQAVYSRSLIGRVSVFATAPSNAVVTFGLTTPTEQLMTGDGTGRFFGTLNLPDMTTLPATVKVNANITAVAPATLPATIEMPLVDLVTVTRADYDYGLKDLTIEAHSSDQFIPSTLSAFGLDLVAGTLTTNLSVAPTTVTVTSSAGGSATIPVSVIHAP